MFAEIVRIIAQGSDKKYKMYAGLSFISFERETVSLVTRIIIAGGTQLNNTSAMKIFRHVITNEEILMCTMALSSCPSSWMPAASEFLRMDNNRKKLPIDIEIAAQLMMKKVIVEKNSPKGNSRTFSVVIKQLEKAMLIIGVSNWI